MSWFDQRPDDAMMGSFEAVGAEHVATVEPAQFREAMSQLGAAVHVVTTAGPGGHGGLHRDGGVLGVGSARRPAGLPQPPQPGRADPRMTTACCASTRCAPGTDAIADVFAGRTKVPMAERFNTGSWSELSHRRAGARRRGGGVRLPRDRDQGGRDPQRRCSRASSRCGSASRARRSSITSAPTSRSERRETKPPRVPQRFRRISRGGTSARSSATSGVPGVSVGAGAPRE